MLFDPDEADRIIRARLVLLGIQPSEIERMSDDDVWDVLAIADAQAALRQGKMPGE